MKRNIRWIRNRKGAIFIYILPLVFPFLVIFEKSTNMSLRYEITELEDTLKEEKTRKRDLIIKIAELSSAERIEKLARAYGFVNISPPSIVFMEDVDVAYRKEKKGKQSFLARLIKDVFAKEAD